MGCCFGKDDDVYQQDHSPGETTRLLGDPVRNATARASIGEGYNAVSPRTSGRGGDEQSALDRILTQTAVNVIDVTAMDAPNQEQGNYHEISKQYSNRINQGLSGTGRTRNYRLQLPNGVASPHTVLAAPPLSHTDVSMISAAAEKASAAIGEVRIEHKEDLVVPFGVP